MPEAPVLLPGPLTTTATVLAFGLPMIPFIPGLSSATLMSREEGVPDGTLWHLSLTGR